MSTKVATEHDPWPQFTLEEPDSASQNGLPDPLGLGPPIKLPLPVGLHRRRIGREGYIQIKVDAPEDYNARTRLVAEHRVVAEKILGRPLRHGERVIHRNTKSEDNRPSNLELEVNGRRRRLAPARGKRADTVYRVFGSNSAGTALLAIGDDVAAHDAASAIRARADGKPSAFVAIAVRSLKLRDEHGRAL